MLVNGVGQLIYSPRGMGWGTDIPPQGYWVGQLTYVLPQGGWGGATDILPKGYGVGATDILPQGYGAGQQTYSPIGVGQLKQQCTLGVKPQLTLYTMDTVEPPIVDSSKQGQYNEPLYKGQDLRSQNIPLV